MIESMEFKTFVNRRRGTFRIATSSSDYEENTVVRIASGDEFGIGSASPSDVTHETRGSIEVFLTSASRDLVGADDGDIAYIHGRLDALAPGNTSAKAAVDMAVYDLLSRREGVPLYEYLGGRGPGRMLTDMTIGIEDEEETVRKAVEHVANGFRALKLKVGLDLEEDVRRIERARDAVGSGIEFRVDANQGYTVEEAVDFCERMHTLGVVLVEQPVDAEDFEGLKAVRDRSRVPIMADECLKSLDDARKVASMHAADIINIKLMKSAGIYEALMIDRFSKEAGITTMIGCMGEIQVSIAAGLHFALSSDNLRYVDLDSHFSMIDDPSSGLGFEDGYLVTSGRPGLGIDVDMG